MSAQPPPKALVEHSAVELRGLIARGELSPVALLDACLARIDELNPAVNAICARDDARGSAHGPTRQSAGAARRGAGPA